MVKKVPCRIVAKKDIPKSATVLQLFFCYYIIASVNVLATY